MNPTSFLDLCRQWALRLASVFAELAIGIPGVVIVFVNEHPDRWLVFALTAVFIAISAVFAAVRQAHSERLITPYLVVQTLLAVALLALKPTLNFYVIWFYVLAIEAIMALPRRVGMAWLAFYVALTTVLLLALLPLLEALVSLPIFLGGFFFFATFANATYRANEARQESQRLLEELQIAHRQLQDYAVKAEQLAVSEERNRLSREMHDTVGHRLTVASVQLEGILKLIRRDPERAHEMAAVVRDQVRDALAELRQTVATLREPLEADLPLETSIRRLVEQFEAATGLKVNLLLPEQIPVLNAAQRLAIYRTAQEALTNVQKHSGAGQAWVQLDLQQGFLVLRVSDDGMGLEEVSELGGFGLRGIRERANQVGGEIRLEPRAGGGLQLSLNLPLQPAP